MVRTKEFIDNSQDRFHYLRVMCFAYMVNVLKYQLICTASTQHYVFFLKANPVMHTVISTEDKPCLCQSDAVRSMLKYSVKCEVYHSVTTFPSIPRSVSQFSNVFLASRLCLRAFFQASIALSFVIFTSIFITPVMYLCLQSYGLFFKLPKVYGKNLRSGKKLVRLVDFERNYHNLHNFPCGLRASTGYVGVPARVRKCLTSFVNAYTPMQTDSFSALLCSELCSPELHCL